MPFFVNFSVPNMSFNAIRKNKILAKISRFTVVGLERIACAPKIVFISYPSI